MLVDFDHLKRIWLLFGAAAQLLRLCPSSLDSLLVWALIARLPGLLLILRFLLLSLLLLLLELLLEHLLLLLVVLMTRFLIDLGVGLSTLSLQKLA